MSRTSVSFGHWLKQRRRVLDMTQEDLALLVECSLSTIEKIESGERRPSKQIAELLADGLRVPPDERQAFTRFARSDPKAAPPASHEGPSEQAPWRAAQRRHTNLPRPLTPLIGREAELGTIKKELARERVRLLTLTGPPGIGKTRLSIEAASQAVGDFEDGVFFVALAGLSDPGLVLPAIARVLQIRESVGRELSSLLKEYLEDKRALLVLDNLEHLLGASADLADLLVHSPWLKMLVTSRQPLRVRGERVFPVLPLEVPDLKDEDDASVILDCSAIALFVDRAHEANPDFKTTDKSLRAIAEICARLDGLPLAIELVAARSNTASPEDLLSLWGGWLEVPSPLQDVPSRHRTLRDAIGWSYDLLDPGEKKLFDRLAVFAGGCTRSAAEAVCNAMGDLTVAVGKGLGSLVSKGLVRVQSLVTDEGAVEAQSETRYTMMETIHAYALQRLEESGELGDLRSLHTEYYLALAKAVESDLEGPNQAALLALLEDEHDNLRAALQWPHDSDNVELALQLSGALGSFWSTRGYLSEGRAHLEAALYESHEPTLDRAKALVASGVLAARQGDYDHAAAFYDEGLAIYLAVGDKQGTATALGRLGAIANEQGEYERADCLYRESLALLQELGDEASIAGILNNLGNQELARNNPAGAQAMYVESLQIARHLGNKQRVNTALLNLGRLELYGRHNYDQATAYLTESLALCRELGHKGGTAATLYQLGWALHYQGSYSRAQTMFEESLDLCEQLGEKPGIAYSQYGLGIASAIQGGYRQARAHFEESLLLFRQQSLRHGMFECLVQLAGLAARDGDAAQAARLLAFTEAMRDAANLHVSEAQAGRIQEWIGQSRAQLGAAEFEASWQEGQALDLEAAIDLAMGSSYAGGIVRG